jgi:hypothetical protein
MLLSFVVSHGYYGKSFEEMGQHEEYIQFMALIYTSPSARPRRFEARPGCVERAQNVVGQSLRKILVASL